MAAHLGRIFYKGLRNSDKAKTFYLDSIRLLETLKPKTFNEFKWHQLMMKHMDEITKASLDAEESKRTAAEMELRKSCKEDIDELWDKKADGPLAFLKLCSRKYISYAGKEIVFSEEDLKSSKLKSTLRKCLINYHPDKKVLAGDQMAEKDFYLRDEITRIINQLTAEMKGFDNEGN